MLPHFLLRQEAGSFGEFSLLSFPNGAAGIMATDDVDSQCIGDAFTAEGLAIDGDTNVAVVDQTACDEMLIDLIDELLHVLGYGHVNGHHAAEQLHAAGGPLIGGHRKDGHAEIVLAEVSCATALL